MNNKEQAQYQGFTEVVAYTNSEVEVLVEYGEDEFGTYCIVEFDNIKSSKCYYE